LNHKGKKGKASTPKNRRSILDMTIGLIARAAGLLSTRGVLGRGGKGGGVTSRIRLEGRMACRVNQEVMEIRGPEKACNQGRVIPEVGDPTSNAH